MRRTNEIYFTARFKGIKEIENNLLRWHKINLDFKEEFTTKESIEKSVLDWLSANMKFLDIYSGIQITKTLVQTTQIGFTDITHHTILEKYEIEATDV